MWGVLLQHPVHVFLKDAQATRGLGEDNVRYHL